MSRAPKLVFNKTVLFITSTIEEGVLLPCNPLIKAILLGVIARAQHLHPVRISHLLVEGTHVHMIVVVDNPDDIQGFMCRLKTESAHAINHLLGRKKRTVWCEGYDSPVILTLTKCMTQIVYLFTNPARDGLEDSIRRYPGLSTYRMWRSGRHSVSCPWIRRPALTELPEGFCDFAGLASELKQDAPTSHTLTIEPDAWMDVFEIPQEERPQLNEQLEEEIRVKEEELRALRLTEGKGVKGAERLAREPFRVDYTPERTGERTWCLSDDRELRKKFIAAVKALLQERREVLARWRQGDFSVPFPPGLYPPSLPRVVNLRVFDYAA